MSGRAFLFAALLNIAAVAQQGSAGAQPSAPASPTQHTSRQQQEQQQQSDAAAAAAAGAGAVLVSEQLASQDPFAFPAPSPRARQWFGYASPSTMLILGGALIVLAAFVGRFAPKKRRRIRRATILVMLYVTTFAVAAVLHWVNAEGWSRRVWFLADLFEVLVVIDLVAILLFDLLLLVLRIEIANIVHDLALGAAYILAFIGMLHRSGVQLSGIIATSAVVTVVLGLSLQATLGNVLGGIALQLDDSIHVGDWLQLASGTQGKVKAIRWRHTVVETRNWDTVIVPNSALLNDHIVILGEREDQPTQHRMWVYFNVDFRYSPDEVINVVEDALQSTPIPNVAAFPPPNCICFDFARQGGESFANYAVRYWLTDLAQDDPTSSAVRVRVYVALRRANIPLALPGTAVFVSHDDPEHRERKQAREMAHRVAVLEQVEMLASLSSEERLELATFMRLAPFGRGEVITRQNATAHWLYVLTKGEVEVRVRGDNGAEKLVARLSAPNVFGEMGVVTGEPRTASVIAATEVECYRLDKEAFQRVLKHRPQIAESVSNVMARRRGELAAVREGLNADQKKARMRDEKNRILESLQTFFGLDDEKMN
ncbi:MAG TPA: mechanosensitive ion channel family protein [Myxococcales bacterium]|nr:mechanosensitive ion channel family protein [Myxococcales bacterium]